MANRKAVGPDDLPAEVIKLFLDGDQSLLYDLHAIVAAIWQTGEVPQQWKDATIPSRSSVQEGGPAGVRQLPRHLPRSPRRQSAAQDRR